MDETENYLNSILEKRMGSVPNVGGFSKNGGTVARLPKKEEKIESMPTVFRVKHESTLRFTQIEGMQSQSKNHLSQYESKETWLSKKNDEGKNERVEYAIISKRIEPCKIQPRTEFQTVDVSKYRKTTYIPPEEVQHSPYEYLSGEYRANGIRQPYSSHIEEELSEMGNKGVEETKSSQNSEARKKRIFGGR